MIKCQCNNCGKEFNVDDKYAGKNGKCSKCGSVVVISDILSQGDSEKQTHANDSKVLAESSVAPNDIEDRLQVTQEKDNSATDHKCGIVTKWSLLRKICVAIIVFGIITSICVPLILNYIKYRHSVNYINKKIEYFKQGKTYPSDEFRKRIPEMKVFLEKIQPVITSISATERSLDIGINYYQYKDLILKMGTNIDVFYNIPDCYEARMLKYDIESAFSSHEYALSSWNLVIALSDGSLSKKYEYEEGRDKALNEALEKSRKVCDYYKFLMEECNKGK
jgi:hypothetical protein